MRVLPRTALLCVALLVLSNTASRVQQIAVVPPSLVGRVVDEANLLDQATRAALTNKLAALQEKTTDQLVVVTLHSLQGSSIEEFGLQLARRWQIGQKEKSSYVLLIVAPNERKVRIEVGHGLEGILTSAVSLRIIDDVIVPRFRANDFPGGISRGVDEIINVLTGPATALAQKRAAAKGLDREVRALSEDQRKRLLEEMASILKKLEPREEHLMEYLHAIQFQGLRLGWALDWNGRLHKTSDGGLTWTDTRLVDAWLPRLLNPREGAFRSMHFADSQFGLIVGPAGLFQSQDGGLSWQTLPRLSYFHTLNAVFCSANRTCWVAGQEPHTVFRRDDAGSPWSRQSTPAEGPITALQFVGDSIGWAISLGGEIIGTTDGGRHWTKLFYDGQRRFYGLHFVNERLGWVVGANAKIMRTDDGGKTWVNQGIDLPSDFPIQQLRFNAVRFADAKRGWVAGLHGMIFATADAGEHWTIQRFEGLQAPWLTIYALALTEGPTIWAAGNSGNIFVSIDGGTFWFPIHGIAVQFNDELGRRLGHQKN